MSSLNDQKHKEPGLSLMTNAFKHFNQRHKEPGCNFISITQAWLGGNRN